MKAYTLYTSAYFHNRMEAENVTLTPLSESDDLTHIAHSGHALIVDVNAFMANHSPEEFDTWLAGFNSIPVVQRPPLVLVADDKPSYLHIGQRIILTNKAARAVVNAMQQLTATSMVAGFARKAA